MATSDFTEDLEAVARGVKTLAQIEDPDRREAIRVALRLRDAGEDVPDAASRARMRRRVLSRVPPPRGRRVSERLYQLLTWLAFPAPYVLRAAAVLLVLAGVVAGATVASADSLPDEPLYAVKIAAEDLRLALATTPEDRATVELSIAEHRLSEAERLAAAGRDDDAIVATGEYGSHLASAAAELASVENLAPKTAALVGQLEGRLESQQTKIAAAANRLSKDPTRASAAAVLAAVSATARPVPGPTDRPAARIAANAAAVAERVSEVADARLLAAGQAGQVRPATAVESPRVEAPGVAASVAPRAADAPRFTDAPRAADAPRLTATPRVTDPPPSTNPPRFTDDPRATEPSRVAAGPLQTDAPRATPARPTDPDRATDPPRAAAAPAQGAPAPARTAAATVPARSEHTASPDPSAKAAAEAARKAAEAARQAAERAKQAQTRTPPPRATPARR